MSGAVDHAVVAAMPSTIDDRDAPPRGYEFPIDQLKADAFRTSTSSISERATPDHPDDIVPLAPTLSTSFQGIGPTGWLPPDPIFAAGPDHLIQAVNSSFRVTTKSGTTLLESTFSNWFSNVTNTASPRAPFDPKVVYDHFAGRWILLTVNRDSAAGVSYYLMSVSATSNPTGAWCNYALRSDQDGATASGAWADYPQLGIDATNLYITSNQFSFTPGSFVHAKLRIMAKSQFYGSSCASSFSWYDYWGGSGGGISDGPFTLQPVHTFGTPGVEYIVNSFSSSGSVLRVRTVSGTWPNSTNTAPVLTGATSVAVTAYSAPPDAPSPGSTTPVDTGDARLLNAQYRDGFIYTVHTVGVPCTGSPSASCLRYYKLDVSGAPTVDIQESFGAGSNTYYFFPAIAADPAGNIYLVFARTSPGSFVEARYTGRLTTDSTLQASALLHSGEASYTALDSVGRNRWGDYSGIAVDPSDGAVWVFHEYASTPANTWRTWVGRLAFVTTATLTISKSGSGSGVVLSTPSGINCGTVCSAAFPTGTVVSLGASPTADSLFSGWGGDSDCSDATVTMASARNCLARFTLRFSDEGLRAGTTIKVVHITELRSRINSARARCGLATVGWTETPIAGVTIARAIHVSELRAALSAAYDACGRPVPIFTDASLVVGDTLIKAIHILELRAAVAALE